MYILAYRTQWYGSFAELAIINDVSVKIDSFLQKIGLCKWYVQKRINLSVWPYVCFVTTHYGWHYGFVFTFSSRTGSMTYSPWTRASCTDHFLAFHLLAWFLEDQRVSVPCKVSDVIINYIKPTINMYKTYISILYLFDIVCPPKTNKEFK